MAKLVGATYGEALFSLAVEENKVDLFWEEIEGIKEVLAANPELGRLLNHPKILKENKIEVLTDIFKGRISEEMLGFLTLLVTKDRYSNLNGIFEYFITEMKVYKKIGVAHVTTAITLDEAKKKEIEVRLLATTSFQTMEMHFSVDQALIGGMVIRIGDRVIDSSVSTKLYELQKQLLKVQV